MEVKHKEVRFLLHFRDHRQVDHFVLGQNRISRQGLLGLLRQQVVVDLGSVLERGQELTVGDLGRLVGGGDDLVVDLFQLLLEDGVVVADGEVLDVAFQLLHGFGGELARRGGQPVGEHRQLGLVLFEELDVRLPLFVVLLLVEGGHFLLDLFDHSDDLVPICGPLLRRDVDDWLDFLQVLLHFLLPGLHKQGSTATDFFKLSVSLLMASRLSRGRSTS